MSLPTRECGLKCDQDISSADGFESLPTRECGLKFLLIVFISSLDTSLPTRECGLKFDKCSQVMLVSLSLPTRECGLKSCSSVSFPNRHKVTPYAGVWIEIGIFHALCEIQQGHSLRGSVD